MAAPKFESVSAQVEGTANNFSVAVPGGTSTNDIVVVVVFIGSPGIDIASLPSGFAHAPNSPVLVAGHQMAVMWKRATGSDVGTYDFTLTNISFRSAAAFRYSGVSQFGVPWDVTNSASDGTNANGSPPVSVITTVNDTLLVWNATNWGGGAWTPPTGFTERRDTGSETCTSADLSLATAGTSGSVTGVCSGAQARTAWLGALKPIPPATSGAAPEGNLTVSRLVDEVIDALHGYTRDQDQVTELSSPMTETDTTFKVSEIGQVNRGLAEFDEELVYVKSVDSNGNGQIFTWGRGQQGSLASGHAIGAKVTMSPLYPRQRVRDAIYGILREMHPDITPVAEQSIDVSPVRTNYSMPVTTYNILRVEWNPPGPTQEWIPMKRWRQNKTATTVELELFGPSFPGSARARVLYMKDLPSTLAANEDLSALGYPQDIHDVVVLGATARLLATTEPSRLQVQSVQASARAEFVPAGSTTAAAKFVYSLYQARLQELRFWFAERYPMAPKQVW